MGFAATRSVRTYHGSLPRRFKSALAHTSRGTKSSSITIAALTSPAHRADHSSSSRPPPHRTPDPPCKSQKSIDDGILSSPLGSSKKPKLSWRPV